MKEQEFSKKYQVRKLDDSDVDIIYDLCRLNTLYYEHYKPFVSKEFIKEDLSILPIGITIDKKYYVGYFDGNKLIAIMDLIDGYPNLETVFIGFFMVDIAFQGKEIGSSIIEELINYLKQEGYQFVRLAWLKSNKQSEHFWFKNGFTVLKEALSSDKQECLLAERKL